MSKEVTAITMPRGIIDRLDKFLETQDADEMGLSSRPQVVTMILRKFLEDMEEKIQGKKNFGMNDFEYIDTLNGKCKIQDKHEKATISIRLKEDDFYCEYCKSQGCRHTMFLMSVLTSIETMEKLKGKIPEKLKKLLKEIGIDKISQ